MLRKISSTLMFALKPEKMDAQISKLRFVIIFYELNVALN